jgi:hypothetical protein
MAALLSDIAKNTLARILCYLKELLILTASAPARCYASLAREFNSFLVGHLFLPCFATLACDPRPLFFSHRRKALALFAR